MNRKRIYAIHLIDGPAASYPDIPFGTMVVYIYRKTRDERTTQHVYTTRRGDRLTHAMQRDGYQPTPFTEGYFLDGVLPYTLAHREVGVKFEIPGRFNNLSSFDELEPAAYARREYEARAIRREQAARLAILDAWADDYGIDLSRPEPLEELADRVALLDLNCRLRMYMADQDTPDLPPLHP